MGGVFAVTCRDKESLDSQSLDQQQLEALKESTWSPTPGYSAVSSLWPPSVTTLPAGEEMERETLQLQEHPSNISGEEVGVLETCWGGQGKKHKAK